MEELEKILTSLEVPTIARRIYTELLKDKSLSARMLGEILDVPRPSIYDHIRYLQKKNLILEKKHDGKKYFVANDPNKIQILLDQKESEFGMAKKLFAELLPKIRESVSVTEPKIQFFSGVEGIKSIQNDILWARNTETYTLWPTQKIVDLLGEEYLAWHNKRRKEENISVKVLRQGPKIDTVKYSFLKEGDEFLRTVKYLPLDMGIEMSYWIYGDKVAFFDSSPELYGFIVHSKSFSHLMKIQFMNMWDSII
jgi:HTH-type transcriptional regulator, sugar sensing transcriptional regulator